jgi:predicted nucleic acid-binding protein
MICVDASVAFKLILDEEQSDRALALYQAALWADDPIVAPPLLMFEITNILRQRMRAPQPLSLIEASAFLDDFLDLRIAIRSPAGLHRQALILADDLGLPATYDAHYLALSKQLACDFWTADTRLIRQVQNTLSFVRWIGDYAAETMP